ncbi:hepatocellular carcinoma-associated antigen 59-domain-containing protein, partial [Entophlyctis helioformis]
MPDDAAAPAKAVLVKRPARKQRAYRKRTDDEADEHADAVGGTDGQEPGEAAADDEPDSLTLKEALELRKLRRRAQGISLDKLEKGLVDKKAAEAAAAAAAAKDDPWKLKSGGGLVNMTDIRGRTFGDEGAAPGGSFESASTAMDTSKHMQSYIETELRKRRGDGTVAAGTSSDTLLPSAKEMGDGGTVVTAADFDEELFKIPENWVAPRMEVTEDNVTLSAGMLTAIPEIDLGIENKLKNIEQTESAKRKLLDDRSRGGKKGDVVSDALQKTRFMPAERFSGTGRGRGGSHFSDRSGFGGSGADGSGHGRDGHGSNDQGGSDSRGSGGSNRPNKKHMATDALVMDRFKKRMRR